jgi:hypothetical protein
MNTPHPPSRAPVALVHDEIDALLKADASRLRETHIDDGGFTLAIMDHLPARRTLSPWVRNGIPVACAFLAALFAFVFAGAGNFVIDASMDVATASITPAALAYCALVALLMGTAIQLGKMR